MFTAKKYATLLLVIFSLFGFSTTYAKKEMKAKKHEVDLKKSQFKWKADKKVTGGHYGKIFLKSGHAEMASGSVKSGEFVMDMASFTVDDLEGKWKTKFMDHVKSGDFFEVKKHPTATLKIEKVEKGMAQGQLTIKGKPQPVKVKFTQKGKSYSGKFVFDRTKHGITYNSENFVKVAADKIIKDTVELEFTVVLK